MEPEGSILFERYSVAGGSNCGTGDLNSAHWLAAPGENKGVAARVRSVLEVDGFTSQRSEWVDLTVGGEADVTSLVWTTVWDRGTFRDQVSRAAEWYLLECLLK